MTDEEYAEYQRQQEAIAYQQYQSNCTSANSFAREVRSCQDRIDKYKKKIEQYKSFKSKQDELISAASEIGQSASKSHMWISQGIGSSDSRKNEASLLNAATKGCEAIKSPANEAKSICDEKIQKYEKKIEEEKAKANRNVDSYNQYANAANSYRWTFPNKSHI